MCDKCICEELEIKLNRAESLIHALEISLSNLASSIDRIDEERLYWKNKCDELREQIPNTKEG